MSGKFNQEHRPLEIRLIQDEKILEIDFDTGEKFRLPAELLRVESPSAEVQGHSPDQKKIVPGRRHVGIIDVKSVGNYAISIKFDDLHDTGIYTWDTLYDFGQRQEQLWQNYLDSIKNKGLSRDP